MGLVPEGLEFRLRHQGLRKALQVGLYRVHQDGNSMFTDTGKARQAREERVPLAGLNARHHTRVAVIPLMHRGAGTLCMVSTKSYPATNVLHPMTGTRTATPM